MGDMKLTLFKKTMSVLAVAIVFAGSAWFATGSLMAQQKRPETLSPALFKNDPKARAAYQIAKEIPQVLEQLPCFCGCDMHFGHKNNLYCFSDMHGSGCDMCEDIAILAGDLHKKGYSVAKIKEIVVQKYKGANS